MEMAHRGMWRRGAGIAVLFAAASLAGADPAALIARTERMPRSQRLGAYVSALGGGVAPEDRPALVKAFARHAQQVSPLYGRSSAPIDTRTWTAILRSGFDPQKPDVDVAMALGQLFVDANDRQSAVPVITAFKQAHPGNHQALAWSEWLQEGRPPAPLTFPIHFCVLTRNPAAHQMATEQQCRKECDILNSTFKTHDGVQLARFTFKSFSGYADIKDSKSLLITYGDARSYNSAQVQQAFNTCTDPRVRDPKAINVYIFDSFAQKSGEEDVTSHGKRNSNRPFVFLDWQRLDSKMQNAEAHEMGHAFGLEHVGVPGAVGRTSTNIMTSAAESFGSGGLRDLGFSPAQAALVRYHAARTHSRLGLGR